MIKFIKEAYTPAAIATSVIFTLGLLLAFGIAKFITGDWATLLIFFCGVATCYAIVFVRLR